MTLRTSFIVGLAVAALAVGVQTASAAPPTYASERTSLVQPDFGQNFLYPDGSQSGYGYLGNPPASASAVGSGSEIDWPQQLGIGFGVGIAVLLGLILTVRIGRSHPVTH